MTDDSKKVGYGHPPSASRFRRGKSGNPKGRPKGIRNLKTDFQEELGEKIFMREGDRQFQISKQRAIVKALVAAAIGGDGRAINTVLGFWAREQGEQNYLDADISTTDRSLVDQFIEREIAKRERAKTNDGANEQAERKDDE